MMSEICDAGGQKKVGISCMGGTTAAAAATAAADGELGRCKLEVQLFLLLLLLLLPLLPLPLPLFLPLFMLFLLCEMNCVPSLCRVNATQRIALKFGHQLKLGASVANTFEFIIKVNQLFPSLFLLTLY